MENGSIRRFGVLIVGAGNIASKYDSMEDTSFLTHVHMISVLPGFHLHGFYDIDSTAANVAAKKWNTRFFEIMEEALTGADIVCIAVPDRYHIDSIRECLIYKNTIRAFIIEKPIATNTKDAKEIVDTCARHGIPIFLNYSRRYRQEFSFLRDWIRDNAGVFISGVCHYGKGTIHNASHLVDILRFLFGDLLIRDAGFSYTDYSDNDKSYDFTLETHNGSPIYFHPIPCCFVTVFEFDLFFEKARVKYSDENGLIEFYAVTETNSQFKEKNYTKIRECQIDPSSALRGLYNNVYDNLLNNSPPLCTGLDGVETLNIVERIGLK